MYAIITGIPGWKINNCNMKQIKLYVMAASLYNEVERTTAYLGAKQATAEDAGRHFDRVAAVADDRPMLRLYSTEALSALAEKLKGIVAAIATDPEEGSGELSLTLNLSESYDPCLTPSAQAGFRAYMSAAVIARWLRLVNPEKEGVWQGEAQRLLTEITATLYHRNPPKRH